MVTTWITNALRSRPETLSGHRLHSYMQTRLMELASQYGYTPIKEFPVSYLIQGQRKLGHLDLMWFKETGCFLACEIDSSFRKKSIFKLLESQARHRLWIYYGQRPQASVLTELWRYDPDGVIELVILPVSSRSASQLRAR